MAIDNPIYVDQNALHRPSSIRLLSYGLTSGEQGVLGNTDCVVRPMAPAANQIQVMPGAFNVLARHLGGAYESYAGKIRVAEQSLAISPTTSGGGRSDLVILRIENPYVSGSGAWEEPADPVEGPYAFVRVIEGVPSTTWDHRQLTGMGGDTWSAITLGRIDRGASTNIVSQSDIRDLRSLAALGGTRTVIIENPPVTIPPVAQSFYLEFKASDIDPNYKKPSGGTDNAHDYLDADTNTKNWPIRAVWDRVPVPDWAVSCDAEFQVFNAQILVGDVFGDMWLDFGGTATTPQTYAIDYVTQPGRWIVPYGATFTVPPALRGRLITVRTKFRSRFTAPGRLDAKTGTVTKLALNFQRRPDY